MGLLQAKITQMRDERSREHGAEISLKIQMSTASSLSENVMARSNGGQKLDLVSSKAFWKTFPQCLLNLEEFLATIPPL